MRVGVRRRRGCVRAGQPRSGHKNPVGKSHIIGPRRAGVRGAGGRRSAQAKPSQHHSVRGAEPRPPRVPAPTLPRAAGCREGVDAVSPPVLAVVLHTVGLQRARPNHSK